MAVDLVKAAAASPRRWPTGNICPNAPSKEELAMEKGPSRKLAVILHADVVGSTALVQVNETLAHERIQDTFRRFSQEITAQGGRRVKFEEMP